MLNHGKRGVELPALLRGAGIERRIQARSKTSQACRRVGVCWLRSKTLCNGDGWGRGAAAPKRPQPAEQEDTWEVVACRLIYDPLSHEFPVWQRPPQPATGTCDIVKSTHVHAGLETKSARDTGTHKSLKSKSDNFDGIPIRTPDLCIAVEDLQRAVR